MVPAARAVQLLHAGASRGLITHTTRRGQSRRRRDTTAWHHIQTKERIRREASRPDIRIRSCRSPPRLTDQRLRSRRSTARAAQLQDTGAIARPGPSRLPVRRGLRVGSPRPSRWAAHRLAKTQRTPTRRYRKPRRNQASKQSAPVREPSARVRMRLDAPSQLS
jgi:hypothetical protein